MTHYERLLYEAQVYLNYRQTGQLPKPLYDMPVDVMFAVFAIQADLEG